jgi:hypothetical protein
MSDTETNTPSGSSSARKDAGAPKRKPNPQRNQARSMFQSPRKVGLIQIDSDFLGYTEDSRNNVDMTYDPSFVPRIAEPYLNKAEEHASRTLPEDLRDDEVRITFAMISLCTARKLILSTPQSDADEVFSFTTVRSPMFVPANLYTILANLGKMDFDSFTCRYKYGTQDIYRILLQACKVMSGHSHFRLFPNISRLNNADGTYGTVPYADVELANSIFILRSSASWIRDQAKDYVTDQLKLDIPITLEGQATVVSFPYLEIVESRSQMVTNVAAWLVKLSPALPNALKVAKAALLLCCDVSFLERPNSTMRVLLGRDTIPDDFNFHPYELFAEFNLVLYLMHQGGASAWSYFIDELVREVYLFKSSFDTFLNMQNMPDDGFGSAAQLFAIGTDQKRTSNLRQLAIPYMALNADATAKMLFKIDDPGLATVGTISGFTMDVDIKPVFRARLRSNVNSTRARVAQSDFVRGF